MLRRNARLRKEYLYKKALEDKEAVTFDKKRKLQEALDKNKPIPTELKSESKKLRTVLDLADERTEKQHKSIDDEYAYLGVKDDGPKSYRSVLSKCRLLFAHSHVNATVDVHTRVHANGHEKNKCVCGGVHANLCAHICVVVFVSAGVPTTVTVDVDVDVEVGDISSVGDVDVNVDGEVDVDEDADLGY